MSIEIEIATTANVTDALPLLAVQFAEHHIELEEKALERVVKGLVEVEGRGRIGSAARSEADAPLGRAAIAANHL